MPHELGYTEAPCTEDIEGIKTMKKWLEKRTEREQKKEAMQKRALEKLRRMR